MDEILGIPIVIGLVLFIVWGINLFKLSQSRKSSGKRNFYLLFLIPIFLSIIGNAIIFKEVILGIALFKLAIIAVASILYLGFWSYSLYDAGGNDKVVWFILILLIPPIWILYQATELR